MESLLCQKGLHSCKDTLVPFSCFALSLFSFNEPLSLSLRVIFPLCFFRKTFFFHFALVNQLVHVVVPNEFVSLEISVLLPLLIRISN